MGDSDGGNDEEKPNSMTNLHICIIWLTYIMKKINDIYTRITIVE